MCVFFMIKLLLREKPSWGQSHKGGNLLNPNLVLFPFTSKSFAVVRILLSCVLGNAKELMYFSKTQFIPYDRVQSSGKERS